MPYRSLFFLLFTYFQCAYAAPGGSASVELFYPQGEVKSIRQVKTRFSESMVSFGDPRQTEPFVIDCPESGSGRWADDRNWVYDFDHSLPAGVRCRFTLKKDLISLAGHPLSAGESYQFNTGGPAIKHSLPSEGELDIDEHQVFILGLDAPAKAESVPLHAYCAAEGIGELISVRILEGIERRKVLENQHSFLTSWYSAILKYGGYAIPIAQGVPNKGSDEAKFLKLCDGEESPIVVLACSRTLPYEAPMKLIWGQGIESLSGIQTTTVQELAFTTRRPFEANFSCNRVNKKGQCIPVLPISLGFSAPIASADAERIRLVGEGGKAWKPKFAEEKKVNGFIQSLNFVGPFPEKSSFRIELPPNLQDDSAGTLRNAAIFPLTVLTDENPPLAKFPAPFGILESKAYPDGTAALPVTLRQVENQLAGNLLSLREASIGGQMLRLAPGIDEIAIIRWLRRISEASEDSWGKIPETGAYGIVRHAGSYSIFKGNEQKAEFSVPKTLDAKTLEVVGIPLKTGFHVVELKSPRLGEVLFDQKKPYYVSTAALVTNLSVHFKQGRESSLVWVTSLDKGAPVAGAEVAVRDCNGFAYWAGKTNKDGIAKIEKALPSRYSLPDCLRSGDRQYFVTAHLEDDYSFVLSEWNGGIASWRFNLPRGGIDRGSIIHAVLDRTLFRAGETVSMKLLARQPTRQGFALLAKNQLGAKLIIRHVGSDQTWEQSVRWDDAATAVSSFLIPKDAKKGLYELSIIKGKKDAYDITDAIEIGSFRVEAFRIPTMRAVLHGPTTPAINVAKVPLDVQVNYLSGGGATGLSTKVRARLEPRGVSFPGYEDFTIANGTVQEGKGINNDSWVNGDDALDEEENGEEVSRRSENSSHTGGVFQSQDLVLDANGGGRVHIDQLPKVDQLMDLLAEVEYRDANGETLASTTHVPLWPSAVVLGIKTDSWLASKDLIKFQVLALDTRGNPAVGVPIKTNLLQREYFAHRKRLIGGFYAYENGHEVKRLGDACSGTTDNHGLLLCELKPPVAGNLIIQARASDEKGSVSSAYTEAWIPGDDSWFTVADNDRIDLLPEKRRYEPGETARFQVRMPFQQATALITVEREGILDAFVRTISRDNPVIELPLKGNYAPNVFVSALLVRGRVGTPAATALVDLGKPAYKMGMASIDVGWRAHELEVKVTTDHASYRIREKAAVAVKVQRADGKTLPKGSEVALIAVDEGLLELMPNESWKLLDAMMHRRNIEVETATAQMQVVGKRHFGRKSQPPGGGGGRQSGRELFNTLLLWHGRAKLDDRGEAHVEVPLNDSLSSFRIVAIAHGGAGLFGTGQTSIRSTQDLILLSGLPPVVREQDQFRAMFTLRNTSERQLEAKLAAHMGPPGEQGELPTQQVSLAPGEAKEIVWAVKVPLGKTVLPWEVVVKSDAATDHLKLTQKVVPAVPVRTYQATVSQITQQMTIPIAIPVDAIPGRGGVNVSIQGKLADHFDGVREYMNLYPYTCLEQRASQAIALQDEGRWRSVMTDLSSHLDRKGLAKYFAVMEEGSDVLTAYLLSIAKESQYEIPSELRARMEGALVAFVEGRIVRHSELPTADLSIRKLAAMEALSRGDTKIQPNWLDSISVQPNLWPTSAVLDWFSLLENAPQIPNRTERLAEAERIIRSRLNLQGSTMGFSTERNDALWWLMVSGDVNANRLLALLIDKPAWRKDIPRLVNGSLNRQQRGHWDTTVANAWGVLAMKKFSTTFEVEPVTGSTSVTLGDIKKNQDWQEHSKGSNSMVAWPSQSAEMSIRHNGSGKPWATIRSLAAILQKAIASGYRIARKVTPIQQKVKGEWHRGDVWRVRLELEAQSDMSWVVVDDPIPAGASILGSGLGRDSKILSAGEKRQGRVWPAFEERTLTAFHAYYSFVPKGRWTVEYTVRLNNPGEWQLPPTHVEAMYAPEFYGEIPNEKVTVNP